MSRKRLNISFFFELTVTSDSHETDTEYVWMHLPPSSRQDTALDGSHRDARAIVPMK